MGTVYRRRDRMNDDTQRIHARLDSVLERVQAALNDLNKRQMMTVEYAAKTGERVEKIDVTLLAVTRLVQLLNERLDNADKDTEAPPAADAEAQGGAGMVWGPRGFPDWSVVMGIRERTNEVPQPSGGTVARVEGADKPVGHAAAGDNAAQLAEAERIINSICYGLGSLVTPEFRARMQRWLETRQTTNAR
jgi:hypothetical protein